MKKIFTLFICISIAFIARSQSVPSGDVMLGGTLGFSHQNRKTQDAPAVVSNSVNLNPSIGKFYRDNRMAGVNLYYNHATIGDNHQTSDAYGGGVFLRQYLPLRKSFYIFAEEGVSFLSEKSKQDQAGQYYTNNNKKTSVNLYFYPGLAYGVTKRFQLELALNPLVSVSYLNDETHTTQNGLALPDVNTKAIAVQTGSTNTAFGSLSFGVKWLLSRK